MSINIPLPSFVELSAKAHALNNDTPERVALFLTSLATDAILDGWDRRAEMPQGVQEAWDYLSRHCGPEDYQYLVAWISHLMTMGFVLGRDPTLAPYHSLFSSLTKDPEK